MTAIPRLLRSSKNLATRRLLEAGLRDRAPERAVLALTVALGLDAVASAGPAQSALQTGKASAPVAPGGALPVASATLPSALNVAKWLLIGACAGGISSGGYWLSQGALPRALQSSDDSAQSAGRGEPASPRAARVQSPLPPQKPGSTAGLPNAIVTPASGRTPNPRAAQGALATSFASPPAISAERFLAGSAAAQVDGALERETRLVDGARQALAEHDSSRASALLDNYDATKVLGVLDREALLLRVELSLARGDRQGARALAERFALRFPSDAHSVRLRALLSAAARDDGSPR